MPEQQQKKREEKTQDDQEQPHAPPNPLHPAEVPGNFVGKISAPNDQKLREFQIGPEHHKSQQEAAQVLELRRPHYLGERFPVGKPDQDGDRKGHGRKRLGHHEEQPVNGGVPAGLQRHDPVDARKRYGKSVDHQTDPAQSFEAIPERESRLARVLQPGPFVQEIRKREPNREIENRANNEKFGIEIGLLRQNDRLGLPGPGPTVDRLHSREKRQRRNGHERERAGSRFEDAPNDERPPPSRQVLHHQERQGTQRDANPEQERNQVGAEKIRLVRNAARDANREQHAARKDQPHRQSFEIQRRFSGFAHFDWPVNFARSASGTSPICTCLLSCRARMYAMMAQRSRGATRYPYGYITPNPFVITSK